MRALLFLALLLAGCGRDERPPAPTPEQSQRLDEASNMLDEESAKANGGPTNKQ